MIYRQNSKKLFLTDFLIAKIVRYDFHFFLIIASKRLMHVLNSYILQTHRVKQILAKDQMDSLKSEAPQAEYDVTVSVLNPRPDIMDAKWHVQMAVESTII